MAAAAMRYRVKGSRVYIRPQGQAYETVGSGRRSIAMRAPDYGPNAALQYAGPQLRNQSREAIRKNGYAEAIVDRLVSNMIGTGIVPQPKSPKARELWRRWTDQSSADGTLDFYGQQAQAARGLVGSGECFVRFRQRRQDDGLAVPLQLQVLESDFVPFDKSETTPGGGYISQGIQFNAIGQRTRYWMLKQHPADQIISANFDMQPMPVLASEVMHVFDAIARPGQHRGEPWLTRALAKLKDLDSYDDAELKRKNTSALMVGFIKRLVPEGMSEAMLAEAWGSTAKIENGVGEITLEPGSMQYLEPGEEITWNNPQDVGANYETFMREQKRGLAVAAKLLYEQLTGDFSQLNDRTWRAAMNEFRRRCEMWQHHLIVFQFCRPVWARFAALARIQGLLTESEAPDMVTWVPQKWAYINPVQDIEAETAEIRAGLSSRSQKATERGMDSAQIDTEQAADNGRADELGLKYDSDGRNAGKSPSPSPAEPEAGPNQPQKPNGATK